MAEKIVKCPNCGNIITCFGNHGEIVKITCSSCYLNGKVTFKKTFPSDNIAIEVNNLVKKYDNLLAVNNISFKIKKGEIFAFLGPNGAGKTTTVEMIESIRQPTSGNIWIDGKDIKTSFNDVKEKIGILPQEFHSFEKLTVKETLIYFSKIYKKRADINYILNAMDLMDEEKKYYKDLSGGLKQRVGVAISLVNDPDIVFLDEPTTGLDPKSRREVWEVIAELRDRGKTVFLTTHYMEEAEYLADHIAIIHKGKIIAEGSLDELIYKYGDECILRIKKSSSKKIINILMKKGFDAYTERNGDIAVKIKYKERILEILSILKHECIEYDNIDIKRSNLEEIFLKITGSKLLEAGE
jgi:ABC-2 type transport system ATP-binding protein